MSPVTSCRLVIIILRFCSKRRSQSPTVCTHSPHFFPTTDDPFLVAEKEEVEEGIEGGPALVALPGGGLDADFAVARVSIRCLVFDLCMSAFCARVESRVATAPMVCGLAPCWHPATAVPPDDATAVPLGAPPRLLLASNLTQAPEGTRGIPPIGDEGEEEHKGGAEFSAAKEAAVRGRKTACSGTTFGGEAGLPPIIVPPSRVLQRPPSSNACIEVESGMGGVKEEEDPTRSSPHVTASTAPPLTLPMSESLPPHGDVGC